MNRKNITRLIVSLVFVFGVFFPVHNQLYAQNYNGQEKINNFKTALVVNADSSIQVEENIIYDFGTLQKHGIYRDIPVDYNTTLGSQSIGLKNISVMDENGNPYKFTTSKIGNKEEIKIGDANNTITGVHVYKIKYKVERAIGYFDSFDEIYWNATGNEWLVPVLKSSVVVTLPVSITQNEVKISCYQGFQGSTGQCLGQPNIDPNGRVQSVTFDWSKTFEPGQGLTVAVGFPKNIVHAPTTVQKVLSFISDNPIVLLPFIVFLMMFYLWWKNGRDPKGSGVIVAEYEAPDAFTPLEIAGILSTKIGNDKLSAEIIYLATKGYIKITKLQTKVLIFDQTDYELVLLKPYTIETTTDFDYKLLSAIFPLGLTVPKKLSELKNHFFRNIPLITKSVYESLTTNGYYKKNPESVGKPYKIILSVIVVLVYLFIGSVGSGSALMIISIITSVIIILGFGKIMPAKTEKGALAKDKILGLKEYLQIAEKDRINFHNAPEKNPALFEKLLSFAMVLGVEKAWAKEFEGIYNTQPSWYNDPYHSGMFNAMILTNSLGSFNSMASSTFASAPGGSSGSGGGGFSGGGGGGGGGGSW